MPSQQIHSCPYVEIDYLSLTGVFSVYQQRQDWNSGQCHYMRVNNLKMVFDKSMLRNPYTCRFSSWLLPGLGRKASSQTPLGSYYSCQGCGFLECWVRSYCCKDRRFGDRFWFISPVSGATLLSPAAPNLLYQETVEPEWVNRQVNWTLSLHSLLPAAVAVALGDRSRLYTTFTILRWLSILHPMFILTIIFWEDAC